MTEDVVSRASAFLTHCLDGRTGDNEDVLDHWVRSNVMAVGQDMDKLLRRALR